LFDGLVEAEIFVIVKDFDFDLSELSSKDRLELGEPEKKLDNKKLA